MTAPEDFPPMRVNRDLADLIVVSWDDETRQKEEGK